MVTLYPPNASLELSQRIQLLVARPRTQFPIKLTFNSLDTSPFVFGRSEICVSENLLAELNRAEWDAVLSHELVHFEQEDGVPLSLVSVSMAPYWMNPFNRILSARLREATELFCDERADPPYCRLAFFDEVVEASRWSSLENHDVCVSRVTHRVRRVRWNCDRLLD